MSFVKSRRTQKQNNGLQCTHCPEALYDLQERNGIEYIAEEVDGELKWVPNDYKDKVKTKIFSGFFSKRR